MAWAATPTMTLTGVGSGNVMGGVYVNPYQGRINYPDGSSLVTQIICDDYFASVSIGQTWSVRELSVGSLNASNIGTTRWGSLPNAIELYQQAAYLALKLVSPSLTFPNQGFISFALWTLFTPTADDHLTVAQRTEVNKFIEEARNNYSSRTYNDVFIYTPTSFPTPGFAQEMLVVRTPEPGAIGLMLLNVVMGLTAVVVLRRRLS